CPIFQLLNVSTHGAIESHSNTDDYLSSLACTWQINAPRGKKIAAWFDFVHLSPGNYSSVTVIDGEKGSRAIGRVDGRDGRHFLSPKYISTGNVLLIYFQNPESKFNSGFRLHYEVSESLTACTNIYGGVCRISEALVSVAAVYSKRQADCSNFCTISENSGEIASHSNGCSRQRYGNNLVCSWRIAVARGKRVMAWFAYVDLEEAFDWVALLDGDGDSKSGLVVKVSKSAAARFQSPIYVSTGSKMLVKFKSDSSVSGYGFRMHFKTTESTSNGSCLEKSWLDAGQTSGVIYSHGQVDTAPYSPNMSCSWTLPVVSDRYIHLLVFNLSIGSGDVLSMYGRWNGSSYKSLDFPGWTAKRVLQLFSTETVKIDFKSDGLLESTGFVIHYRYDEYCTSNKRLTAPSGQIEVHSGIGFIKHDSRRHHQDCRWTIDQAEGNRIAIQFAEISVAPWYFFITVLNASGHQVLYLDNSSNLTDILHRKIHINSNLVVVEFVSNDTDSTEAGFRLLYKTSDHFCHNFQNLTVKSDGEIESHAGAGATRHRHNTTCTWQINAPVGKRIAAWFVYVDLEKTYDTVTFFDGKNGSLKIAKVSRPAYTNYSCVSPKYISSGNVLSMFFSTDVSVANTGFRIRYEVIYEGHFIEVTLRNMSLGGGDCFSFSDYQRVCDWYWLCNPFAYWASNASTLLHIKFQSDMQFESNGFLIEFQYTSESERLTTPNGTIASHSGHRMAAGYWMNMQRSWQIVAPLGRQISAWFTNSFVSLGSINDTVVLYDGWRNQLALLRGGFSPEAINSANRIFRTSSNRMRISFTSGNLQHPLHALGFELEYTWSESFCHGFKLVTESNGELVSHSGAGRSRCLSNMRCRSSRGNNAPDWTVESSSNFMFVSYLTGSSFGASHTSSLGFRLKYQYQDAGDHCSGVRIIRNESKGEICSHTNAGREIYAIQANCEWQVVAPKGHRVVVRFTYMGVSEKDLLAYRYQVLHGNSGEIFSHSEVGVRPYLDNMLCEWLLVAKTRGYKLCAQISYASLQSANDTVTLLHGNNGTLITAVKGGTASAGHHRPTIFCATSGTMAVIFSTDGSGRALGFRLRYEAFAQWDSLDANESSALKISLSTLSAIFLVVSAAVVAVVIYKRKFGLNIRRNPFISRFTSGSRRLDEEGIVKYSGTNSVELPNEAEHDS
uniref:CUB domain-containing protein n=1 Tax=Macrostomum lignano TaxID=282301 RepID=A0A1I8GM68_9PLAT